MDDLEALFPRAQSLTLSAVCIHKVATPPCTDRLYRIPLMVPFVLPPKRHLSRFISELGRFVLNTCNPIGRVQFEKLQFG